MFRLDFELPILPIFAVQASAKTPAAERPPKPMPASMRRKILSPVMNSAKRANALSPHADAVMNSIAMLNRQRTAIIIALRVPSDFIN